MGFGCLWASSIEVIFDCGVSGKLFEGDAEGNRCADVE
jgi:hypothetical protein